MNGLYLPGSQRGRYTCGWSGYTGWANHCAAPLTQCVVCTDKKTNFPFVVPVSPTHVQNNEGCGYGCCK